MRSDFVKKSTDSKGWTVRVLDAVDSAILRGWRVFKSLKFGISLLAIIGLVAIWGTMSFASNAALGDNAIPMARTMVFEHPAFIALLLLFASNLIVSTWHVTKMSLGIWWKREFRRGTTYYEHGSSPRGMVAVPGGVGEAERILRKRFTRVQRDGEAFFAHSGLVSRMGPTIVHIGMLTVIGAMVAKAILLWNGKIVTEGRFIAAEGEQLAVISQPLALEQQITDRNRVETLIDVWVRVLDFDEVMHPNSNVPAYFSSLVEVRDPRTQEITVAQLDMNHSMSVETSRFGRLQFHQAGYQAVPDGETQRVNFDVRDRGTGERIAVTDASAGTRVRVGEADLFLEVDGVQPADRWRLYELDKPDVAAAEGLLTGGRQLKFTFRPEAFFPDFRISESTGQPVNNSEDLNNPALRVTMLLDGKEVDQTWLFYDAQLASMMKEAHPRYRLALRDIRVPRGDGSLKRDWSNPASAVYDIGLTDKTTDIEVMEPLAMREESRPFSYEATVDHGDTPLGKEGNYEVRIVGPTQRYLTVLSVVNEPTVGFVKLGVLIVLIGALMTFLVRYRAFYGLWDEAAGTMRMALVPRWGQSPVQAEFDELTRVLSGGKGLLRKAPEPEVESDEVRPEHQTVNAALPQS